MTIDAHTNHSSSSSSAGSSSEDEQGVMPISPSAIREAQDVIMNDGGSLSVVSSLSSSTANESREEWNYRISSTITCATEKQSEEYLIAEDILLHASELLKERSAASDTVPKEHTQEEEKLNTPLDDCIIIPSPLSLTRSPANTAACSSLARPGAYHIAPRRSFYGSENENDNSATNENPSFAALPSQGAIVLDISCSNDDFSVQANGNNNNTPLAVAQVVNEESSSSAGGSSSLEIAIPVDNTTTSRKMRQQEHHQRKLSVLLLGALLLTLVVWVLVKFVSETKDSDESGLLLVEKANNSSSLNDSETRSSFHFDLPEYTVKVLLADTTMTSPQYRAYHWLMKDPLLATYSAERLRQRFALATFYYAMNGEDWIVNQGVTVQVNATELKHETWMSYNTHECQWYNKRFLYSGVLDACSAQDETLEHLILRDNNLRGTIPPEVALLSRLRAFGIKGNLVESTIPDTLGPALTDLKLFNLQDNDLSGPLPNNFATTRLFGLNVQGNRLTGTIPETLYQMTSLGSLYLQDNFFSGTISSNISQLAQLTELNLQNNEWLSGTFPSSLANLSSLSSLTLNIQGTSIQGTIDPELCAMEDVQFDCSPMLCGCSCPCIRS